jgi:hypothetical protein
MGEGLDIIFACDITNDERCIIIIITKVLWQKALDYSKIWYLYLYKGSHEPERRAEISFLR